MLSEVFEPVILFCEKPPCCCLNYTIVFHAHFSLPVFASFKKSPGKQWAGEENTEQVRVHSVPESCPEKKTKQNDVAYERAL